MNEKITVGRHDKPTAYESPNSYDYNLITDREFEELLHSIFEQRIQSELGFREYFTAAWLPTGVGERGQDVILTNGELRAGLIQCKRVNKNLSKPACAQEIIKFGIHAVLDGSLISPEGFPFTYFFAVSTGFANTAIELLSGFNSKILIEDNYRNWVEKVLNNYEGFKNKKLKYDDVSDALSKVLTRLKVKIIVPSQLDLWLSMYPPLVSRFYRVKIIETGIQQPLPQTTYSSSMTAELISERFMVASSTLRNYPSSFGNLNYHIDRVETDKLLLWIKTPLKQKEQSTKPIIEYVAPIAVLTGDAGYGKTVVMRDLLSRLNQERIPTLAIKADKSTFSRQQELVSELQLGDDLIKQAYTLSDKFERIVIIVDQLDALSQHLSANREPLKMYNRLIDQLANIPNVRLVIACRRFDLQFDPNLVQYQDKHVVKLELLSRENVQTVFAQLNLPPNALTKLLYDVLSVPLHLTVFCKVHKQISDFTQLRSVQDLYHELWKQKIMIATTQADTVDSKRVVELVRLIAKKMNEFQEIHVAHRLYETNYSNELFYLRSEGIINVEGTELQFLHQSFFDYVYARTFVDDGLNLAAEIAGTSQNPKHQGLFVRSKIRQILLYLREVDPRMYHLQVKTILTSPNFRFHIKLLVIQSLAFQNDPTQAEQRLVESVIFKEPLTRDAFLESISSPAWLSFLNNKQLIQLLLTENYILGNSLLYPLCNRINPINQSSVVDFLMTLPDFPQVYEFIALVLRGFKDFEDTRCLTLFEQVVKNQPLSDFYFYHIIGNAIKHYSNWVSQQVWLRLLPNLESIGIEAGTQNYLSVQRNDFFSTLDKMYARFPEEAIELGLQILIQIIERTRIENQLEQACDIYSDLAFMFYIPDRDERHYKHYELDTKLRNWMTDLELTNSLFVRQKVEWLFNQKATSLISMSLWVIHAYPNIYANQFFTRVMAGNFITHFYDAGNEYFKFSVIEGLRLCFPYFTTEQKQILTSQILTIKLSNEGPNKRPFGLSQYYLLIALPNDYVNANIELKNKKQQLNRRFKNLIFERPKGVQLMPAQILSDNAYSNMSDEQWINSFIKYNSRKNHRWDGVDELSHSQRFGVEVTKNPGRFVNLIGRIINEKDIPDLYINQGLDGLVKGEYNPEVVKSFLLRAISRSNDDQLQLVWLTLYLVNNKIFDEEIFTFLEDKALNSSQEDTNDDKAVERGINQSRGAAAGPLVKYAEQSNYQKRVFDILEKSVDSASVSTRAAILYYHIGLNNVDKQRNLSLFIRLCTSYETELAQVAIYALQYHIHIEFESLIAFFEKAITAEDAADPLTKILTNAYMFGYSGSERLLNMYLSVSEKNVASCISHALDYIASSNPNYQQKGLLIANRFLNEESSEIVQAYRYGFDDLTVKHFPIISEFLFAYVNSKVGRQRDGSFYSYLLKCVQEYPDECLKLVEFFENHDGPDISERMLEQEPLEVVLQAYNTYKTYEEPDENLDCAMDLFDSMLKMPAYRREARKAANDI